MDLALSIDTFLDACGTRDPLECWYAILFDVPLRKRGPEMQGQAILKLVAPPLAAALDEIIKSRYLVRLRLGTCGAGHRPLGAWGLAAAGVLRDPVPPPSAEAKALVRS